MTKGKGGDVTHQKVNLVKKKGELGMAESIGAPRRFRIGGAKGKRLIYAQWQLQTALGRL